MVFGDSLSAGYGLSAGKGWVNLLQKQLDQSEHAYQLINASISGETSSGGAARIAATLQAHKPSIVIVALGANDGLRGLSISEMRKNLTSIIQSAKSANARVLLLGMQLPPNYGLAFTRQFEKTFFTVAKNENISLVPFLFKGFESDMRYFQNDRVHPNENGQQLMLDNVWPYLEKLL